MPREEYEKRIASIFGTEEVPDVTGATLQTYRGYLVEHLDRGLKLTGREDFPWEERYVFGYGDPEDYEELKKDNPSYKDVFELLEIVDEDEPEGDLLVRVRRLSDSKTFKIGLSWLTPLDDKSSKFQLLDDFATWVANYI
jgi:hypothetical protein